MIPNLKDILSLYIYMCCVEIWHVVTVVNKLDICFFLTKGKADQKGGAKGEKTLNDFAVEYAKSNRSTCKGCEQKIEKVTTWLILLYTLAHVDIYTRCLYSNSSTSNAQSTHIDNVVNKKRKIGLLKFYPIYLFYKGM